jgi:hypothetical protein
VFYGPTRLYLGEWAVSLFKLLVVTGSFACGMAFTTAPRATSMPWAGRICSPSSAAPWGAP